MKHSILTLLFISTLTSIHAQQTESISILKEKAEVGRSTIPGQTIPGEKISFGTPVYKVLFDSVSSRILVQLRRMDKKKSKYKKDGTFLVCDSSFKKPLWKEEIDNFYGDNQFRICRSTNSVLIDSGNELGYYGTGCFSLEFGIKFWHENINKALEHPEKPIGICLGTTSGTFSKSPAFRGIDMNSGKKTWTRKMKSFCPAIQYASLNDSTVIAVYGGLHSIDLNTGKGWDIDMKMNNKGYASAADKSTAAAVTGGYGALGAVGMMLLSPGSAHTPSTTCSNVLITGSDIYLAGKDHIICCNKQTGDIIWSDSLQEKQTSKSQILLEDNKLILINYGYSINDAGEKVNYGEPFVAAYNPRSGSKYFMENLIDEDTNPITDFSISNSQITLLFPHKAKIISLEDGKSINEVAFPEEKYGSLCSLPIKKELLIGEKELNLAPAINSYKDKLIVKSLKGNWITTNLDGTMNQDSIPASNIWTKTGESGKYTFLQNAGNQTYALMVNGKITAYLNVDRILFIVDKWLYALKDYELIRVMVD